jgi:uncharacterized membrane protein
MRMLYECTLQRNCSMTPRQVARAYAVLCTLSLTIALAFFLHGVWIVLAFSLLELGCVGLALLLYARHALDRERIALSSDCLLVECVQADIRSQALPRSAVDPGADRRRGRRRRVAAQP